MPGSSNTVSIAAERNYPALVALGRHLAGADGADLVQDTLLAAIDNTRPVSNPLGWLRQAIRNRAISKHRSARRRQQREHWASSTPELPPTPEEQVARSQLLDALHEEWSALPAPYEEALRLRFEDGLTAREIGQHQGCPTNTASWRVREGLKRLRERLDRRFEARKHWLGALAAVPGVTSGIPPAAQAHPWTMKTLAALITLSSATAVGITAYAANDTQPDTGTATASAPSNGPDSGASPDPDATPSVGVERPGATAGVAKRSPLHDDAADAPQYGAQVQTQGTGRDSSADEIRELTSMSRLLAQTCAAEHHANPDTSLVLEAVFVRDEQGRSQLTSVTHDPDARDSRATACLAEALFPDPDTEYAPGFEGSMEFTLRPLTEAELSPTQIVAGILRRDRSAPQTQGLDWRGHADAPTDVVACVDPDCPYARASASTLDQVLDVFAGRVRVAHLQYPLAMHDGAERKSRALIVARSHGAYWPASDYLHMHAGPMTTEDFVTMANELELDANAFVSEIDSDKVKETLADEQRRCERAGGRGSPTFFVEGYRVAGAHPFEVFERLLGELGD